MDRRDKRYRELRIKFRESQNSLVRSEKESIADRAKMSSLQSEVGELKQKLEKADNTIDEMQSTIKSIIYEHQSEITNLVDDNKELHATILQLEKELSDNTDTLIASNSTQEFTIQTKESTRYLNSVRELYYGLMTTGISPEKIDSTIRMVLSKLCSSLDVESLKLPKKSCANYMRMAEMPTVSDVHKATITKLIGSSINGTVLGIQEVSDGTADTMIAELDRQLTKLRETAMELNIHNANSINWTLMASSTSDGAATQTKFTKLLGLRLGMNTYTGQLTIPWRK